MASQGRARERETATVWAVRLGTADQGDPGTLSLSPTHLAFEPDAAGRSLRIALGDVTRVKAVLGSPVLIVRHRTDQGHRLTAFYFAQPPPLPPRRGEPELPSAVLEPPPLPFSTGRRRSPRGARLAGIASLAGWNRLKKPEVRRWRNRIRQAVAAATRGA